jgi:hypothetical protein
LVSGEAEVVLFSARCEFVIGRDCYTAFCTFQQKKQLRGELACLPEDAFFLLLLVFIMLTESGCCFLFLSSASGAYFIVLNQT